MGYFGRYEQLSVPCLSRSLIVWSRYKLTIIFKINSFRIMESTREVNLDKIKLRHPFTMMVAGPTGSGKTHLVRDLLEQHKSSIANINKDVINVVWAYGIWQNGYQRIFRKCEF